MIAISFIHHFIHIFIIACACVVLGYLKYDLLTKFQINKSELIMNTTTSLIRASVRLIFIAKACLSLIKISFLVIPFKLMVYASINSMIQI